MVGARLEVPYEFYTFQTSTVYAAGGLTQSQLLIEQKVRAELAAPLGERLHGVLFAGTGGFPSPPTHDTNAKSS